MDMEPASMAKPELTEIGTTLMTPVPEPVEAPDMVAEAAEADTAAVAGHWEDLVAELEEKGRPDELRFPYLNLFYNQSAFAIRQMAETEALFV
jgi:hypothetical protein